MRWNEVAGQGIDAALRIFEQRTHVVVQKRHFAEILED